MKRWLRRLSWIIPALGFSVWVAYWLSNYWSMNFHRVLPGVYRSAQLPGKTLAYLATRYHMRSVINLRKPHPGAPWYQDELQVVKRLHLHYYNLSLPVHQVPTRQVLQQLIVLLQTAPRPVLLHCWQGSDRTGLAAAMAVLLREPTNLSLAKRQVSWYYNVLSPTTVGYQVLRNYATWLKQQKLLTSKQNFLRWVSNRDGLQAYWGAYLVFR